MKLLYKFITATLLILVLISSAAPFSVSAAGQPTYPTSISGLPVFFIQTAENTFGFSDKEVVLVLYDADATSPEESILKLSLSEYLSKSPLPEGYHIEIYGGKNASKEEYIKSHYENNAFRAKQYKLFESPVSRSQGSSTKSVTSTIRASFTIDANVDPSSQSIYSQAAEWNAPTVGNNQNQYSALLNNALIDLNSSYMIQTGHLFASGVGRNVYSTPDYGYIAQYFNLPYTVNHTYKFSLYKYSYWYMQCQDINTGVYDYFAVPLPYDRMRYTYDQPWTSIFFENYNTNANWYQGFSPTSITVSNAKDGLSYTPNKNWGSDDRRYQYDGQFYSIGNKITGSLANGGTATWNLQYLPLGVQH